MSTTFRNIGEELLHAKQALRTHIGTPKEKRGDDYEAKRDTLTAEVEGLAKDFNASQLADLPEDSEGSRAKARAHAEKAVNNISSAGASSKGLTSSPSMKKVIEAARQGFKGSFEIPEVSAKALIDARLGKAISRTDMSVAVGYDDLYVKPTRPPQILDFLPSINSSAPSLTYRRRTTPLSGAVNRAEGNALGEIEFDAEPILVPFQGIGSIADFTIEEMQDDAAFAAILGLIADDVLEVLDGQVMIGNGTSPNLTGITTTASPQTTTYATSRLATTKKGMTALRTTERAAPGLFAFNPVDWDNIYLDMLASPSFAITYVQNGLQPRLHGVNAIEHEDLTAGTCEVMDPRQYQVVYRQGLTMESTDSDGSKFGQLVTSYRCYLRAALRVQRLGVRHIALA